MYTNNTDNDKQNQKAGDDQVDDQIDDADQNFDQNEEIFHDAKEQLSGDVNLQSDSEEQKQIPDVNQDYNQDHEHDNDQDHVLDPDQSNIPMTEYSNISVHQPFDDSLQMQNDMKSVINTIEEDDDPIKDSILFSQQNYKKPQNHIESDNEFVEEEYIPPQRQTPMEQKQQNLFSNFKKIKQIFSQTQNQSHFEQDIGDSMMQSQQQKLSDQEASLNIYTPFEGSGFGGLFSGPLMGGQGMGNAFLEQKEQPQMHNIFSSGDPYLSTTQGGYQETNVTQLQDASSINMSYKDLDNVLPSQDNQDVTNAQHELAQTFPVQGGVKPKHSR